MVGGKFPTYFSSLHATRDMAWNSHAFCLSGMCMGICAGVFGLPGHDRFFREVVGFRVRACDLSDAILERKNAGPSPHIALGDRHTCILQFRSHA
jgi:hypothetical protein